MIKLNIKVTIPDLLLTALTIFISFSFLFGFAGVSSDHQTTLLIYKNGQLIQQAAINQDKIISVQTERGEMKIELKAADGARILEANCPARICIHSGWIKRSGETVVCLPNKVLLEIIGEKEEYDAISY